MLRPLEEFADFIKAGEPLAPYTKLKVGGPAEALVQPRSRAELAAVVRRCAETSVPLRVLGGGGNILVRDEGVKGAVLRLSEPAFTELTVNGSRLRSGSGASLRALISEAARHGLSGVERLVAVPGTVGGALRTRGEVAGELGHFVRQVEILDRAGHTQTHERDELRFDYRAGGVSEPILLSADFELEADSAAAIVKRMRKAWIQRKAEQPFSFQAAVRVFKDPHGMHAAELIEQAGLAGTRVGGAEISERHANYIVAASGTTARDVLRLIDLVRSRIEEEFDTELELGISVW